MRFRFVFGSFSVRQRFVFEQAGSTIFAFGEDFGPFLAPIFGRSFVNFWVSVDFAYAAFEMTWSMTEMCS